MSSVKHRARNPSEAWSSQALSLMCNLVLASEGVIKQNSLICFLFLHLVNPAFNTNHSSQGLYLKAQRPRTLLGFGCKQEWSEFHSGTTVVEL